MVTLLPTVASSNCGVSVVSVCEGVFLMEAGWSKCFATGENDSRGSDNKTPYFAK